MCRYAHDRLGTGIEKIAQFVCLRATNFYGLFLLYFFTIKWHY
jgi:hypothetical protein